MIELLALCISFILSDHNKGDKALSLAEKRALQLEHNQLEFERAKAELEAAMIRLSAVGGQTLVDASYNMADIISHVQSTGEPVNIKFYPGQTASFWRDECGKVQTKAFKGVQRMNNKQKQVEFYGLWDNTNNLEFVGGEV